MTAGSFAVFSTVAPVFVWCASRVASFELDRLALHVPGAVAQVRLNPGHDLRAE